jgi:hypothetical protein
MTMHEVRAGAMPALVRARRAAVTKFLHAPLDRRRNDCAAAVLPGGPPLVRSGPRSPAGARFRDVFGNCGVAPVPRAVRGDHDRFSTEPPFRVDDHLAQRSVRRSLA